MADVHDKVIRDGPVGEIADEANDNPALEALRRCGGAGSARRFVPRIEKARRAEPALRVISWVADVHDKVIRDGPVGEIADEANDNPALEALRRCGGAGSGRRLVFRIEKARRAEPALRVIS